jgi:ATP-dependent DNA helicase DinG
VLLGIITDIVEPNHNNFSKILEELVYKTLCITKGRAFVLFTSYGLLNIIFNKLSKSLEIHNIQPLKQGMTNRHELLHRFTSQKNSALFATDSFWEGVDVVGEALELVIITKLPFKVPKEPIIEARYEAIRKAGGNAFMEYAVPMAVIKFRQGFGRLVRSKSDKGVVAIFDSRIVRKAYGKTFLRSLPVCNTVVGTQKDYFSQLSQFFNSSNFS